MRNRHPPAVVEGDAAMTPFMLRVADVLGSDIADDELPVPETRPSKYRPVGKGNDIHVAYRGLTEQLVCEANAMLSAEDDHMTLVDEIVGNEMLYSVYYRGRAAVVSTVFGEGTAYGRVVADGLDNSEPRELAGPESVEDLLLLLLMESDTPRHPSH
jgi:hypothetical protein